MSLDYKIDYSKSPSFTTRHVLILSLAMMIFLTTVGCTTTRERINNAADDQNKLLVYAKTGESAYERKLAIELLTDVEQVADISNNDVSLDVREAAKKRFSTLVNNAVSTGDIDTIRQAIKVGVDPVNSQWSFMFELAAKNGHSDVVDLLLSTVTDSDRLETLRFKALKGAVSGNQIKMADLLIEQGADPTQVNKYGHADMVEFLISKGVDPKQVDNDGNTLLHEAMLKRNRTKRSKINGDLVSLLLRLGLDPTIDNNMEDSLVEHAVNKGKNDLLMTIVDGSDPETVKRIVTYVAFRLREQSVVNILAKLPEPHDDAASMAILGAVRGAIAADNILNLPHRSFCYS